jgi:hypothetical protein
MSRWLPPLFAGLIAILLVFAGVEWTVGLASKRNVPIAERRALVGPSANPTAANPVRSKDARKSPDPSAKAPERSPELKRLVELRAYAIWVKRGRPMGQAGEAVKEANWLEAERQVLDEVTARAFKLWNQQGCPTAEAGEAVREMNMRDAAAQLLKETEAELRRHPID